MGANILDASFGLGDSEKQESTAVARIHRAGRRLRAGVSGNWKFHIVDVLQKRGHIVGMTGARGKSGRLCATRKQADCGIAVSGATDAAAQRLAIKAADDTRPLGA